MEMMELGEKADRGREEQDELMKLHAAYLDEGSRVIQEEGGWLEKIHITGEEDPPLDEYIVNMEALIRKRMERDRELYDRVMRLQKCLREEEETHIKVISMSRIIFRPGHPE